MSESIDIFCSFLSRDHQDELSEFVRSLHESAKAPIEEFPIRPVVEAVRNAYHPTQYDYMPALVLETAKSIEDKYGKAMLGRYNKIIAANLVDAFDDVISGLKIPPTFHEEYPWALGIWLRYLKETPDEEYVYPNDFYLKDARILTGRGLWYRSRIWDQGAYLRKSVYRNNGWKANLSCLFFIMLKTRGLGPFFRSHIDHRFLVHRPLELREKYAVDFHILQGQLFELNPEVKGILGAGWMDDPALGVVSPRHADGFVVGRLKGVYRRRDGTNEISTAQALAKSETRRKAYARGEYQPLVYTSITPRRGTLEYGKAQTARREAGLTDKEIIEFKMGWFWSGRELIAALVKTFSGRLLAKQSNS